MSENTYMIVYDVADPRLDLRRMQFHIKEEPEFTHWWNHLPSLFLVQTKHSAAELAERLRDWLRDVSFIVMQVDPANASGWLPEDAGEWVRRRTMSQGADEQAVERAS